MCHPCTCTMLIFSLIKFYRVSLSATISNDKQCAWDYFNELSWPNNIVSQVYQITHLLKCILIYLCFSSSYASLGPCVKSLNDLSIHNL